YLPILFHAVLGVYFVFTAKYNAGRYGYLRNWLFLLQRVTGITTLIFIAWHVWETRVQVALGNVELGYSMMENILSSPVMVVFYILGILSTTFHLANGLWGFAVSWGILQSPRSQKVITYGTLLVFVVISYIGIRTIIK